MWNRLWTINLETMVVKNIKKKRGKTLPEPHQGRDLGCALDWLLSTITAGAFQNNLMQELRQASLHHLNTWWCTRALKKGPAVLKLRSQLIKEGKSLQNYRTETKVLLIWFPINTFKAKVCNFFTLSCLKIILLIHWLVKGWKLFLCQLVINPSCQLQHLVTWMS